MEENNDIEFLAEIMESSSLLFYGEFEDYLNSFLKTILQKKPNEIGFEEHDAVFGSAYWFWLSFAVSKDLMDYGTSPRGAWFTEKGERFKRIILQHENALEEAADFTYKKYNS